MSTRLSFTLLVPILLALASPATFAQNNWIGPYYGTWSTAGNWSLNHVPTPTEDVTMGTGTFAILDINSSINSLALDGYLQNRSIDLAPPPYLIITDALDIGSTGALGLVNLYCLDRYGVISAGADSSNAGYLGFLRTNMSIVGNLSNSGEITFNFYSTLQITGNLINSGSIIDGGGPVNSNGDTIKNWRRSDQS